MRFLRRRVAPAPPEGPLAEVLDAEKAAAAAITAARLEAEAWLAGERRAIGKEMDARLKALATQSSANEDAARQAAVADAATIVADADGFSRELRALDDRELLPVVARRIAAIIPGPQP